MPMLLSTPEQWFRTQAQDFYEFRPTDDATELPVELTNWIRENLPQRQLETLGPSEHSGWVCGGPGMQVLAMNEEEVAAYSARWEDGKGNSMDPRWQCFQWRYQDWLKRFQRIQVFQGYPPPGMQYRWLLCAGGLFWLQGRYVKGSTETSFPGQPCFDDWVAVRQRFPDLVIAPEEPFCMGYDYLDHDGHRRIVFEIYQREDGDLGYASFPDESEVTAASQRIRLALALPLDAEIGHGFF